MKDTSKLVLEVDSNGVVRATGNLDKFAEAAKKAEQSATGIDSIFSRMNMSSLAAVAGVTALIGAFAKLKSGISNAIGIYGEFETLEVSLTGVMKNLGNTQKAADDFIGALRKLSNETTFGYDTLAGVAQQMLTVGVSTKDTKTQLIQLGNIAGGSTEKFNRLADVYTKILATGKATSTQVQQLSMITGTSFVNALGKTSASAKEVTNLLKDMTDAGGMFEGAMDSLIDTVEGKQGFVTDTFREMMRNFADASGLVDSYKFVLDALYGVLQMLADKLVEINNNPLQKALLSGAMTAVFGTLVSLIGVGIVGAVKKLNSELTKTVVLKSILDPKTLAIAAGIGIVAGAVAGVATAWKKVKDNIEEVRRATGEFNTVIDKTPQGINVRENTLYEKMIEENSRQIEEFKKSMQRDITTYNLSKEYADRYGGADTSGNDELLSKLEEEIECYKKSIELLEEQNAVYQRRIELNEKENSLLDEYARKQDDLAEILQGQRSSNEKALDDLMDTLDTLEEIKKTTQEVKGKGLFKTDDVERQLDSAINNALKKERELKIKIAVDNLKDWQKVLKDAMDLSDEEVFNGFVASGAAAIEQFAKKLGMQEINLKEFRNEGLVNVDDLTVAEDKLENINSVISAMEKSGLWKASESSVSKMKELRDLATADVYDAQIRALDEQLELMRLQTDELREQELIREGFSQGQAKSIVQKENEVAKAQDPMAYMQTMLGDVQKGYIQSANSNFSRAGDEFVKIFQEVKKLDIPGVFSSIGSAFQSVGAGILDTLKSIAVGFASSAMSASGDLQAFMEGFQSGGIFGGIIATVVEALMNVCKGIDGFEDALNPVTYLFENLSTLIRWIMSIISEAIQEIGAIAKVIDAILKVLDPLFVILNTFMKLFTFQFKIVGALLEKLGKMLTVVLKPFYSFIDKFFGWLDIFSEEADEREKEAERLRRLNDEYSNLYDAMKEQEEYYLTKKNELNAGTYKAGVTSVNDMIITPQGKFSTAPDDYIIATKNPHSLGGGTAVYVTIQNNAGVEVATEESTNDDGSANLLVMISQKIASDYASGSNGWDSAYAAQQSRMSGRRISI